MVKKITFKFIFLLVIGISFVFLLGGVSATNCWLYSNESSCQDASCRWKSDSGGSWCEELNCWSLWTQDECQNETLHTQIGKTCNWQAGGTFYGCEKISCWSYSGTSEPQCENNTLGLSCDWGDYCQSTGTNPNAECWSYTNSTTCNNAKGCSWGNCYEKGCWGYNDNETCVLAKDWQGRNCKWESGSCTENGCWKYGTNTSDTSTNRQNECNNAVGVNCQWNSNWKMCEERGCWSFDFTNDTACVNNTLNLSCLWSGGYCNMKNCWSYNTNETCSVNSQCIWKSHTSSGWCQELNCWSFDSLNEGNRTTCEEHSEDLNCAWGGASDTEGWCFKDNSETNCTSITTEKSCMDTYYCWWQYTDWNNISAGGSCNEPQWGVEGFGDSSMFNEWNPGCYLFDMNLTQCGKILGCDNSSGLCEINEIHEYADKILDSGLNCTMINDSSLCNNIAMLSSCCSWQNGTTCAQDKFSNTCWDQMEEPPAGAGFCEDYNAFTSQSLCGQIAGSPWYMPCKWNSSDERCKFNSASVFGNDTQSLVKIDNKKNCEIAGGKWIVENYCEASGEGYVSIPSGRCEYKFDEEDNCNKACFACENKNSAGQVVNSSNDAKSACENSQLGFCEYIADSNAPNGFGYCKPKEQFKKGIVGTCSASDCGACTFMGMASGANGTKTPEQYCNDYKANCTWVPDSASPTSGYCTKKGDKTCLTSCDRCSTQSDCQDKGRTELTSGTSGSCKWQVTTSTNSEGTTTSVGSCVANSDGDVEICFDGIDNNDNNLVDCQDTGCYADSFCGLVSGNCWDYSILGQETCESNDCEWVTDMWGSFCDFKGSQCWKYGQGQNSCEGRIQVVNETLDISAARIADNAINESYSFTLRKLGIGWVEESIVIVMNGTGVNIDGNYSVDIENQVINFSNTEFLNDFEMGNVTLVTYQYNSSHSGNCQWNNGGMGTEGWCEMDWSIGEVCMMLQNESSCDAGANCVWTNDTWCSGSGAGTSWCETQGGWCDHELFKPKDCWLYTSNGSCTENDCTWQSNEWNTNQCEINMSINQECWSKNQLSCGASDLCYWRSDVYMIGGGECRSKADECWNLFGNQTGCEANTACQWNSQWNNCESKCFSPSLTNDTCLAVNINGISVCIWKDEPGQCMETGGCWNYNETSCGEQEICRWKEPGFCDPVGGFSSGGGTSGGGGGAGASECWRYDGNQSACANKTLIGMSCGWMPENNPRCEVDWGANCWQYNEGNCTEGNGCWWNSQGENGWCTNIMDQCWNNQSYQSWNNTEWQGNCSANLLCTNQTWGCEPVCFSTLADECASTTGCKYMTGWCNPAGMNQMFTGMQAGAPVMIGNDDCGEEGMQASVDICGFGMKDMGDSYGFGAGVKDFSNASVCNKEKIMPSMFSGEGPMMPGQEQTGTGEETVKFTVYLDTDGITTGGCSLVHNSSVGGYEFRFRYSAEWNDSLSESYNAYRCDAGSWKAVDIKLSTWRKMMCSETSGPMIAVKKEDLAKYPTLYDSTKDFRVFVVTVGNTGNVSSPTDSAGPGWVTPGAVDFDISSAFSYGADNTKFSDILSKGFIKGEDCFNGIDDNGNGLIDCADFDCMFSSKCSNYDYSNDTRSPSVVGVKIEEYPDSALILYDTNKPANGTLEFYGNDSRCVSTNLNASIYDSTIKTNVRNYTSWHDAHIYLETLNYSLQNDTTYYYKLRVCDSAGKCAVSKCSSFKTSSVSKCAFCNFVTRIKAPTSWTVSYDLNQDGTYEHIQGQVCGANAGMKTNYTDGRKANIRINNSDGSVYFDFLNVTLTKTGLNDKVRTISTAGDLIADDEKAGMTSETRDKIINNLHPEVCRVKIPKASDGSCTTLYHCDDSGLNCTDRTIAAGGAPIDSDECLWNVPYCEFSTYKTTATPESGSPGGSPSGGTATSGAVAGATPATNVTEEDEEVPSVEDEEVVKDEPKIKETEKSLLWLWILIIAVIAIAGVIGLVTSKRKKRR
jgi:hypothetical protein